MPFLARITNTFFTTLINRLGVRPPPPEGFELSNVVQPVSIVDADIALTSVSSTPLLGAPFTAGELAGPADLAILADTGAQAAGNYDVRVELDGAEGPSNNAMVRLQRRDAANAANIWSQDLITGHHISLMFRTSLALNERIRLIKNQGATAGITYQGSIFLTLST